ncbi:MAG: molybdopterin molybdenumtransferase MoeA [Myxococcales bacterium]|nr:MAG: molybdopterin molybdenumtransferase MoeA [Myxococcales bacterium]
MLKMIDVDQALSLVLEHAAPRAAQTVPIAQSLGCVLAEEIRADRDYPPFDRAMMDGFAARVADAGKRVKIVGELAAGAETDRKLTDGLAFEIMTGAPCPAGTQAVAPVEDVRREGDQVELPPALRVGNHVAPRGSECRAGATVLPAGALVTPLALANLAMFGRETVRVIARPALAIITTGGELCPPGETPSGSRIRNSNGPMLAAMAGLAGIARVGLAHAADVEAELLDRLGAQADADIVVLSGGVSAGKYDIVPHVLEAHGVELIFHKAKQKPGKPILFGKKGTRLFFGLPGTPQGAYLGFNRYVRAAIARMSGLPWARPVFQGRLVAPLASKGDRFQFILARVRFTEQGWEVEPTPGQGSSDIYAPASANAYIRLPGGSLSLDRGEIVSFEPIGDVA